MICLLDVIAWPMFLIGGSVLFIVVAGVLLCISGVVLMAVAWNRHRKKTKTEAESRETEEP